MKKRALLALAALPLMAVAGTNDPALDLMIQKMIEKGIMPGDEAQDFAAEVKNAVAERNKSLKPKGIEVKSKAKKIEFSGTHYLGYTMARPDDKNETVGNSAGFEFRRNYVQLKAYWNDTDYARVTLDATKEIGSSTTYANAYFKYAYIWLEEPFKNMGIPGLGMEFGVAHRPWIDYEEHNGWYYRSFNKVALEHKTTTTEHGPDLVNSADLGVNVKYKSPMFSSEIGIYNGEGYHADKAAKNQYNSTDLSLEWRLTGHLMGDGTKVGKYDRTKDEFAQVSFYGLMSNNHKDNKIEINDEGEYDRSIYGIHAVYNNPMFLIAGQYFTAQDDINDKNISDDKVDYQGFSINGEFRPIKDWTLIARYDHHTKETTKANGTKTKNNDANQFIYGAAYKMNKHLTWILSGKSISDDKSRSAEKDVYMLTAEVKW
ncbi:MAG: hypothetical protein K6347_06475 [Campylobacterales bacterium]